SKGRRGWERKSSLPYPPLEQHGIKERQTPIWRPVCRAPTGAPDTARGAAADELEEPNPLSRGPFEKIVFALQKSSNTLTRPCGKIFEGSLESEIHFAK